MNLARALLAATLLAGALPAAATADIGPCRVADATYSWWTHPIAHVALDGTTHVGAVSSTGVVAAYRDCTMTVLEDAEADDHDAAAVVTHATKPRIAFYAGHNDRKSVRYRRGSTTSDVAFPGLVAYAQVLTSGDRIVLLTRVGGCAWYLARSDDWGTTWSTPVSFLDDCERGGLVYLTTKPHQATPGVFRLAAYRSAWHRIEYGLIDIATGKVTIAGGVDVGNVRSGAGLPLTRGDLTSAYWSRRGAELRLLDVGQVGGQPLIVMAEWGTTRTADYVTVRYDPKTGWLVDRSLPLAGKPFWAFSMYVGGATIADGGDVVIAREAAGSWRVEQYRRSAAGWSRRAVLATATVPLVRPYAVRGGDSVLVQRVAKYVDYRIFKTSLVELTLRP